MRHYYTSQELADLYGVSRRTVTNWIQQTQDGKLDLELTQDNDEYYIVKSEVNQRKIQQIVADRRKYLNKRSRTYLIPSDEFYQVYSEQQILDMITNIETHRELPLQYTFIGKGSKSWIEFRNGISAPMDAEKYIPFIMPYINELLEVYSRINVVDLGVGTGSAILPLIESLAKANKLNRYIGIDISNEMLTVASGNIKEKLGKDIPVETYKKDFSYEAFREIIAEPVDPKTMQPDSVNIVCLLGGSVSNFREPDVVLKNINRSMGSNDLFLTNFKLKAPAVKHQTAFISYYQTQADVLLSTLGIDKSLYRVEIGYDEKAEMRYSRVRFKKSVQVKIMLAKGSWIINLNKDDTLLTYRARANDAFTVPKVFYDNRFNILANISRPDHQGSILLADTKALYE